MCVFYHFIYNNIIIFILYLSICHINKNMDIKKSIPGSRESVSDPVLFTLLLIHHLLVLFLIIIIVIINIV